MAASGRGSVVVHSYDIGVRHLAQCVLRLTASSDTPRGVQCDVLHWRILDAAEAAGRSELNFNKTKIETITDVCAVGWGRLRSDLVPTCPWPDRVFLELQPATLNNKMQVVSHLLQLFLISNFASEALALPTHPALPGVEFVSAEVKLREADFSHFFHTCNASRARREGRRMTRAERDQDKDAKYNLNKKHAKEITPLILRESGAESEADWFEAQRGKRDDLADAFLMGYYKALDIVTGSAPDALPPKPGRSPARGPARQKRARSPGPATGNKRAARASGAKRTRQAKKSTVAIETSVHPEFE